MLASPDHFGVKHFRSSHYPEAERFEAWRYVLNRWLVETDLKQFDDSPFRASACVRALPDLRFGWGTLGGAQYRRTRKTASNDNDDLFLCVNLGGDFSAVFGNREIGLPAGGACLMSCTEASAYRSPGNMTLMTIRTKLDGVSALVRNVYDCVGQILTPDLEGLQLLVRFVKLLDDTTPLSTEESRAIVTRQVQDLLALTLCEQGGGAALARERSLRSVRLKAIKAFIEKNLERVDLSPELVARQFRVSPRTVQRLFEMDGSSFTEFVLERRLAHAYAALGDLRGDIRNIGEIAFALGFGNISYFNRRFRARYGATPSDIRNRGLLRDI